VSVSLISRPFNENTLLAIGSEYQKQTEWHKRHPKV
jgi:Asp-tRNA(Asn)/Glu-tRNA(Gln) amidotransferase A subunit family amidase